MKVEFTIQARLRQAEVDKWWRENTARPNLFDEELMAAIALLERFPKAGKVFEEVDGREVRLLVLRKSKQGVYYSVDDAAKKVVVQTIWGTSRDRPPL